MTHYAIVTFGSPSMGESRPYYLSLDRAIADALTLRGGSCTNVWVVACASRAEALRADISEPTSGGTVWMS